MGREIIFEVQVDGKTYWPDPNNMEDPLFVCGRDDATTYLAQGIINASDDEEPVLFLTCDDYDRYLYIKHNLQEYYDKDLKEIQKAKDALEDLREARRHCGVYDEFVKFSQAMDDTQDWIEENDYSRAGSLIECLDKCYNKMLDLVNEDNNPDRGSVINKYKVAIILSE